MLSCSSSTDSEKLENKIYIKVTDSNNKGIAGVGLHFYYSIYNFGKVEKSVQLNKQQKATSVDLLEFNCYRIESNKVELSWLTYSEYENAGFELYRSEEDSGYLLRVSYKSDTTLNGHGTTTEQYAYTYIDTLEEDITYFYMLYCRDYSDSLQKLDSCQIYQEVHVLPIEFQLEQNYPNPSDFITNIPFTIPKQSHVTLQVINQSDNSVVKTLLDGLCNPGRHIVQWDGTYDSGSYVTNNVYAYRMIADDFNMTRYLFVDIPDADYLKSKQSVPLAETDIDGKLDIDYDTIPTDQTIIWTDETATELGTFSISDSINIFLIKQGFQIGRKKIAVNTSKSLQLKFTLQNE
ncbi:MAG: hypothetical protein JW956_02790 [Calditrichaceae bacterium]|nr:hypothetical protein [Calditrichaceae bacterium]